MCGCTEVSVIERAIRRLGDDGHCTDSGGNTFERTGEYTRIDAIGTQFPRQLAQFREQFRRWFSHGFGFFGLDQAAFIHA